MSNGHAIQVARSRGTRFRTGTWLVLGIAGGMVALGALDRSGQWDVASRHPAMVLLGGPGLAVFAILASRVRPGTLPLSEGLMRFGAFVASFLVAGSLIDAWDAATLRALGMSLGFVACTAMAVLATWHFGIRRVVGMAMLVGGLAAMAWLGYATVHNLNEVVALFALQAMAAIVVATGGMVFAHAD